MTLVIIAYDSTLLPLVPKILLIQYCIDCTTHMPNLKSQITSIYELSYSCLLTESWCSGRHFIGLKRNTLSGILIFSEAGLQQEIGITVQQWVKPQNIIYSGILGSPLISAILHGQLCVVWFTYLLKFSHNYKSHLTEVLTHSRESSNIWWFVQY